MKPRVVRGTASSDKKHRFPKRPETQPTSQRVRGQRKRVLRFYVPFVLPGEAAANEALEQFWSLLRHVEQAIGNVQHRRLFSHQTLTPAGRIFGKLAIRKDLPADSRKQMERGAKANRLMFLLGRDAVEQNDEYAARQLLNSAADAALVLAQAKRAKPKLFNSLLKNSDTWPVNVGIGEDLRAALEKEVDGLGEERLLADGYSPAALSNWEITPARRWAFAIIEILKRNQILARLLISRESKLATYFEKKLKIDGVLVPHWFARCSSLPEFSRATVGEWMKLGKEMVRCEMPDFDCREEWKPWTRRAETRSKPGASYRGKKREDIFNSIKQAMRTIARKAPETGVVS